MRWPSGRPFLLLNLSWRCSMDMAEVILVIMKVLLGRKKRSWAVIIDGSCMDDFVHALMVRGQGNGMFSTHKLGLQFLIVPCVVRLLIQLSSNWDGWIRV
ncbi:hypothetical protein Droror1_Dr00002361 [Drosera rotundifolia]